MLSLILKRNKVHREPGRQKQCVRLPSELKARSFQKRLLKEFSIGACKKREFNREFILCRGCQSFNGLSLKSCAWHSKAS